MARCSTKRIETLGQNMANRGPIQTDGASSVNDRSEILTNEKLTAIGIKFAENPGEIQVGESDVKETGT